MICTNNHSYLAAERFSEAAYNLQDSAEAKNLKEIKQDYLDLMMEAKALKNQIAKITGEPANLDDIDKFSKEIFFKIFFHRNWMSLVF